MNESIQNKRIFLNGKDCTSDVLKYKISKNKVIIFFNENPKPYLYDSKNVRFIEVTQEEKNAENLLNYFREIAEKIGLYYETPDGKEINILSKNYKKVEKVNPKTILYNFLSGKIELVVKKKSKDLFGSFFRLISSSVEDENYIVYPFGFNISQKTATENALENKLSIIEGPPGTGKTQTILNIIANAVMQKESVAVVSSNNAAIQNVLDKLKKYNVDFIAAFLGSTKNKQEFLDAQKNIPDIEDWQLTEKEIKDLIATLKFNYKNLQEKLQEQEKLSTYTQELSELEVENKHHKIYLDTFNVELPPSEILEINKIEKALELSYLFEIENYKIDNYFVRIIKQLLTFLGIYSKERKLTQKLLEKYEREYLIALCQQKFYEIKIKQLKNNVQNLSENLEKFNFKDKMKDYSELSAKIFKAKLAKKYLNKKRNIYSDTRDIENKSEKFIEDYPVILSTTYSLRNCLANNVMYDYVIVDEASQVDLCTGALALSCAKKAVIVGDLKQLPNVVKSDKARISDKIFKKYEIPEIYRYKNHCLLSTVNELFYNIPKTLLKEHYRCHPKIIGFCNKRFYNNELIILSDIHSERTPLIVYRTTQGNYAVNNVNQRQIDVIKEEIIPNENLNINDNSVGIVTPYRNQTNILQEQFKGTKIKADTVDKFQGQENKVIILSTVDNQISNFTDNPNRINVAISRAIEQLIVVINGNEERKDSIINELINYIDYNNFDIKQSSTYSVFDLLYKCYAEERKKLLRKYQKISQYDSENLMYSIIDDVLDMQKFKNLSVAVHVPLKMIIRDKTLMTEKEMKYAFNDWTHVDFLIYNFIDKQPILAIEVDGIKYHQLGTKQSKRDELKNNIFSKYNLQLLRLSTKGSKEKTKLIKALNKSLRDN